MASGSSAPTNSTSLTQRAALASSLEPHGSQKQTQSLTPHVLREARRRRLLRREEERQVPSEAPPTPKIVLGGSQILIPTLAKLPPLSTHLPVAGATDQRRLRGHRAAPTRSPPPLPWHCGSLARGHWECAGLPQQLARRGGPGPDPPKEVWEREKRGRIRGRRARRGAADRDFARVGGGVELSASGRLDPTGPPPPCCCPSPTSPPPGARGPSLPSSSSRIKAVRSGPDTPGRWPM